MSRNGRRVRPREGRRRVDNRCRPRRRPVDSFLRGSMRGGGGFGGGGFSSGGRSPFVRRIAELGKDRSRRTLLIVQLSEIVGTEGHHRVPAIRYSPASLRSALIGHRPLNKCICLASAVLRSCSNYFAAIL